MTDLFPPIITLGSLGILFGLCLAYAASKFRVPVDPTLEKIIAKLPGANCGACGKAGCIGFAEALLSGELDLHSCVSMAEESKKTLAELLGLSLELKTKMVSALHCCGGNNAKDKYLYDGMKDCLAASLILGGQKECQYGCLTYGTCIKACPYDAIVMRGDGFPKVIEEKCTACGVCVNVCPKHLYAFIPCDIKKAAIYVACSSRDTGKVVMGICPVGCIACGKCQRACPHGAIEIMDNLARIDYTKCLGCLDCVKVCPTKVIKQRGVI